MFEIETVPVPIPDRNRNADSYSKVHIHKPYIAVGVDYYIQLRMTELVMCKSIRYTYYCEELFVVKNKSKHSCASAIFYDLGPWVVSRNCKFDYTYNQIVPLLFWMEAGNFFWPIFMDPDHLNVTPKMVDWPDLLQNTHMQWCPEIFFVTVN